MNDLWLVRIGYPPWHFGPFEGKGAADEYAAANDGAVWPLWEPEEQDVISGTKAITQAKALA